ncbi:hypothetical protein ASG39_11515 [Rhizobium sp. Leaf371]|uniref:BrnT family toxin n=1 Tax=Rhizobium sp. Leaf371 TaxID=1736355 RepID=UPI000713F160|nr:BrnT family toxin [Rhizobium sp. Leaf371]KQS64572.1 hypothetical protein ASG39_11515 [Rhizobium sp. Leaf371]
MRIVFDEIKRQSNIRKHALDFGDLDASYFMRAIIVPAKQARMLAIAQHEHVITAVVFSPLGTEAISIISFRLASKKERAVHEQS